ncbi:MAG: NADPH-dependent FMN reductase [Pseudomonadota bacterium]
MSSPTLLGLCGALRRGSYNRKLMLEAAKIHGGPFTDANLRLPLYDGDIEANGVPSEVQVLSDQIAEADGVIIITPEYNKALSGSLKNALDWVSRTKPNPWHNKPVVMMSATSGRSGGERAQTSLRLCLAPFRPLIMNGPEILVSGATKEFDENGALISERYLGLISQNMDLLKQAAG